MKHTPGPWSIEEPWDKETLFIRADAKLEAIVAQIEINSEICTAADEVEPNEQHGNARLIAAAPELLEALELAIQVGVARLCTPEQIDQIERAIAKARGEQ